MKLSFYNNIVKNRRLLLERSARDIIRYSAGKASIENLFPLKSAVGSDIPEPNNVRDIFASAFSSIEEPYTIDKILTEISKVTDLQDKEIYNNVSIIYNKDILEEKFNGKGDNKSLIKSLTGGKVEITDLIQYLGGYKTLSASSFNKTGEKGKASLPSRFSNPHVAVFKIKDHSLSFLKSKESAYAPFCATLIPSIEMSKCVPHLNISIVDDDKNTNQLISLGKFLVGRDAFETDGFAQGLSTVEFTERQDLALGTVQRIFDNRIGAKSKQNVAGMEVFQSPQSLVNSDINKFQTGLKRVTNPFLPLMSIESFSISDQLKPLEFISTTSGNLNLKLFDRSRLPEIAKLVGMDYLTSVFLVIEFGWSHPDGSIISNNPFGQFLDSMKRRELFVISDSNVSINDDGTASIRLNITSLGEGAWKRNSMSQKYITVEDFNEYLLYFEKKLKDSSSNSLKTSMKRRKVTNILKNELKVNDLIKRENLEEIDFFSRFEAILSTDSKDYEKLSTDIKGLLEDVRVNIFQNQNEEPDVDENTAEDDIKSDVDESEENYKSFLIQIGANEDLLTESQLKSLRRISDETLTVTDKKVIESLVEKAEKIIESAVQSSTKKGIEELLTFLQMGDAVVARSINAANNPDDIAQSSNELSANDMNTVIARLASAGINIKSIISSDNNTFNYSDIVVEVGEDNVEAIIHKYDGDRRVSNYITLGKLLTYSYGLPSALSSRAHDEIQLFFHPANQMAGAFFNISLGDVFIETQKYLNMVASFLYRNRTSQMTCEQHLGIVRAILSSSDYCIGYGVSTMQTPEDGDSEALIEAEKKAYLKSMNSRLSKYYSTTFEQDDLKELQFKPINLRLKEVTESYTDSDGIIRKIRKVHFFDNNSDPYINSSYLLSSLNNTSLRTVLRSEQFSNKLSSTVKDYNNTRFAKFTSNIFKKPSDFILSLRKDKTKQDKNNFFKETIDNVMQVSNISSKLANEIETVIKASVPTIEFGAENGFIQNISMSNNNGGLANKINQMNFVTTLSNPQNQSKARNTNRLYLNPSTVNVTMLGFPIVSIGQTFYITAKTNTTLDNIYRVTSISHSITEGSFSTTMTLEATMDAAFDPVNITKKLIDIGYFSNFKNDLA